MACPWYFQSNFSNPTIKKLKKMGKGIELICRGKNPSNSEFAFCVEFNTETGKFYIGCFVFSKYKDSAQTTCVCLCIIRLLLQKPVVSLGLDFSFFKNF